ncbi:MAG TPA: acetate--CoA ligase family protein [Candidatus Krumholzibacteriaceae bacterium]|nr:acetate--CoA ligase family protein [Candidatus Krumholzibacteriaceae bacterium]
MVNGEILDILKNSKKNGWVLEPDAKRILRISGFDLPEHTLASSAEEAARFANKTGYPVVAKVVSPEIIHKSDVGGVEVNIDNDKRLKTVFNRFSKMDGFAGLFVEKMVSGTELIIGAKIDEQFGPVVLMGIGGVGVELYGDTSIRMAPVSKTDVKSMTGDLKAKKLIEGFRGSRPVNTDKLSSTLVKFSELVMELKEKIESIDLNPVICRGPDCVIADARIILKKK